MCSCRWALNRKLHPVVTRGPQRARSLTTATTEVDHLVWECKIHFLPSSYLHILVVLVLFDASKGPEVLTPRWHERWQKSSLECKVRLTLGLEMRWMLSAMNHSDSASHDTSRTQCGASSTKEPTLGDMQRKICSKKREKAIKLMDLPLQPVYFPVYIFIWLLLSFKTEVIHNVGFLHI